MNFYKPISFCFLILSDLDIPPFFLGEQSGKFAVTVVRLLGRLPFCSLTELALRLHENKLSCFRYLNTPVYAP